MLAIGAATFLGSQLVHLPMNLGLTKIGDALGLNEALDPPSALVVNALVLGFTAAFCEEGARFLVFRWTFARRPAWRSREGALAHGIGHGGVEALALGALVALTLVSMLAMRSADLAALGLPPEQRVLAEQQIEAYWSMPAWLPFVGVLERALTMMLHVALSLFVAHGVATRRFRPVWLAFLAHWSIDSFAVLAMGGIPLLLGEEPAVGAGASPIAVLVTEGAMVVVAIVSWTLVRRSASWSWEPRSSA